MHAEYVDHMGTDLTVVNAAKVSFSKASKTLGDPEKSLIRYLATGMKTDDRDKLLISVISALDVEWAEAVVSDIKHKATHWAPFAHPQVSFRVSAPVPIRTQCFKHKQGFVESEESRRYISSRPVLYVPDVFRAKAADVKQGSGDEHPRSEFWKQAYIRDCEAAISAYELMLSDGVCPEQARFILPQGVEVNWIWTGSLASYARYYNQRSDSHAQKESQYLAAIIGAKMAELFPVSWKELTRA